MEYKNFSEITKCRSCGADIIFLRTAAGKHMPVDAATVTGDAMMYDKEKGHISHFATCPNANMHRRERK